MFLMFKRRIINKRTSWQIVEEPQRDKARRPNHYARKGLLEDKSGRWSNVT